MAQIIVNTTNGAEVTKGHVMLSANLRETKDFKPKAEERYRNVVIPELQVSIEDRFTPLLLDALYGVAKRRFESEMETSKRMARTIDSEDYTIGALLAWYSQEAVSGRMTTETLRSWFKSGDTYQLALTKKGEKFAEEWLRLFSKFASPNHGVNANTCRVLLAGMQEKDAASVEGQYVAKVMQRTIDASQQSQVDSL